MYIMWLYAHITTKRRGRQHIAGEYRAVLELARAMQKQSVVDNDKHSIDTTDGTEAELRRRIVKDLKGGAISYNTELLSNLEDQGGALGWRSVKAYLKKEKFWLLALVVLVGGSIALGVLNALPEGTCVVGLTLALIITLCVGTTPNSRRIIMFWCFWILAVLPELLAVIVILFIPNGTRNSFKLDY